MIPLASNLQKQKIAEASRAMRHNIVDMIGYEGGKVGHLGGSSSICDVVAALYFYKMKVNPKNPGDPSRDRFLLSKGHAALVQYAALAELDYFDRGEIYSVKTVGSMLQGHPDITKTPGIEANTGSLGMGLSIGLGMALGLKGTDSRVYVVVGDGELQEGQVWEAAMAASNFGLENLTAIIDRNGLQATDAIENRMKLGDVAAKWAAFGWRVIEIDGHSISEICDALDSKPDGRPTAIIARTVKGKHVSFAENNPSFHNGALTKEQFETAHREIAGYEVNI